MIIWLIQPYEPLPSDPEGATMRTGRLASALAREGHGVTWFVAQYDHQQRRQRQLATRDPALPGVTLEMLPARAYKTSVSTRRVINHLQLTWQLRRALRRRFLTERPDVVVASLPIAELAAIAARFCRARRLALTIDVRDRYPDAYLMAIPRQLRWLATPLIGIAAVPTRYALRRAELVTTVSESYVSWAAKHIGKGGSVKMESVPLGFADELLTDAYSACPPQLTSSARAPDLFARVSDVDDEGADSSGLGRNREPSPRVLLFVGALNKSYDLGPVILAARILAGNPVDLGVRFAICGDGEQLERWRKLATGLANVEFLGWADRRTVAALGQGAWATLAAYSPDAVQSLPNKWFEYIAFGRPILYSLRGDAEKMASKYGLGLRYTDAKELAEHIYKLGTDGDLYTRLTEGCRVARGHFPMSLSTSRLVELVTRLGVAESGRPG